MAFVISEERYPVFRVLRRLVTDYLDQLPQEERPTLSLAWGAGWGAWSNLTLDESARRTGISEAALEARCAHTLDAILPALHATSPEVRRDAVQVRSGLPVDPASLPFRFSRGALDSPAASRAEPCVGFLNGRWVTNRQLVRRLGLGS
jgi:hypothetical protein